MGTRLKLPSLPGAEISRVCRALLRWPTSWVLLSCVHSTASGSWPARGDSAERLESDWRKK